MLTLSTSAANYHHGRLREALIAAALDILNEGGPGALSLREAARRAGVSAMAPYRHFADREALLAGVAAVGFERFRDALVAADASCRGSDALIAQGAAYVGFALAHPALFRLMFGATPAKSANLASVGASAYRVLAERVASLVGPARAEDWTLACWSIVHGVAMLALDGHLPSSGADVAGLTRRLLNLIDPRS